jgi:hypothetical protein
VSPPIDAARSSGTSPALARTPSSGAPATLLPTLGVEADWKLQPRLWGHSFHPMCSYLASFPAALAHAFVARYSRPGDVVLDPFSGRGTTPLEATSSGRIGVGNDLNPLAHLLTAAKLEPATPAEARTRAATLRLRWNAASAEWLERAAGLQAEAEGSLGALPREVALAFHPRTLAQLLFVRSALDLEARVDRFLAAALSGILHGKSASYLSTLMPNTFSMAPRYVRAYAGRTAFRSPERDVFAGLDAKLTRLYRDPLPTAPGIALLGDAREAGTRGREALQARGLPERARLVMTSPPYLRVIKYGYYNWLRAWFLGLDVRAIDRTLDDAHRREPYLAFLGEVLRDLQPALTEDGIAVLVVGDVASDRGRPQPDGIGLAEQVWEIAAEPAGYRLAGVALDDVHAHRKVTQLWGDEAGRATQTDRIVVLAVSEAGRRRALAGANLPVDWTWPPRLRAL